VNDRDFLPAALAAIDAATERVKVAQYLLYDDASVDALVQAIGFAAGRGLSVQVLADETGGDTQQVLDELALYGVQTQLDSPDSTLHNKLIIADDVVLVGSHNFTWSALELNHEASVLVADAEVADWYASWFDTLWAEVEATPQLDPLDREDLVPLADRAVTEALLTCIGSAVSQVDVVMYAVAWNDNYPGSEVDQVLTALESAHDRGLTVNLVFDGSSWIVDNQINDAAVSRLTDAGLTVLRTPSSRTTHAKVLKCDDTVIVSDANWSYSGLVLAHGTSIQATASSGLPEAYAAWMERVRDEAL